VPRKAIPHARGYYQEPLKRCFADDYKMAQAAREYNLSAKFSTTLARVVDMAHKQASGWSATRSAQASYAEQ
jgi:hypothetical protein